MQQIPNPEKLKITSTGTVEKHFNGKWTYVIRLRIEGSLSDYMTAQGDYVNDPETAAIGLMLVYGQQNHSLLNGGRHG